MNISENLELQKKKKAKILIVDDDKVSRFLMVNMMKKNEYLFDLEIDEAVDGEQGLKKINTGDYDVVFLDYNMPVMNGIDCLKGITVENRPNIIMVTGVEKKGVEGENVQKLAYENQVYNYLKKPIDSFSVIQIGKNAINDALSKRELREKQAKLSALLDEKHETQQRIDSILDGHLSHEVKYIESINKRKFPMMDICVFQKPYDRGAGDIFMHNKYRERSLLSFSLFDISGHSLETSVDAQHVKLLRLGEMGHPILNRPYTMEELVYIMNDKIKEAFSGKGTYSTYAEVRFQMADNTLEVVNSGSEAPFIIRSRDGIVDRFKSKTLPLGVIKSDELFDMFGDFVYKTHFERGDYFFMSSDGLVEAEDEKGIKFLQVVPHIIKKNKHLPVSQMQALLLQYYQEHTGSDAFHDDITFCLIKFRDDYTRIDIDLDQSMDDIYAQVDSIVFEFEQSVGNDFITKMKTVIDDIIKDRLLTHHFIDKKGSFFIEYLAVPGTNIIEMIINMIPKQSSDNIYDGYEPDTIFQDIELIMKLTEITDKCFVMDQGKKIVLNFVY